MNAAIEIESLSKKYVINPGGAGYKTLRESLSSLSFFKKRKELWALKDIFLTVEKGDTLGVIGENGAGKTTLLKIISKITNPTSGSGKVSGRVATLLEVGTGFHPELTGRENIYLNGVILGLKKKEIDKKYDDIIDFAGVSDFLNTPLKHYSTGMWARLAFSVAAHLDPDILLVDEVLSVGDAEFQNKSLSKMNELSDGGRTVIFVSHNMPAIRKLCNRCIYISDGEIKKTGASGDVVDFYLSRQTTNLSGNADFNEYTRRKGSQKVRLKKVELKNQNNDVTGRFLLKDDLNIHLWIETKEAMKNVKIIVKIADSSGETIAHMYDSDSGFRMEDVKGTSHVSISLKDIRFYPGRYNITIFLLSEIFSYALDLYDEIENAISFDIDNQLVSNRLLSRKSGLLFLTPDWYIH